MPTSGIERREDDLELGAQVARLTNHPTRQHHFIACRVVIQNSRQQAKSFTRKIDASRFRATTEAEDDWQAIEATRAARRRPTWAEVEAASKRRNRESE